MKRGFTLIELLVVVLIIGILSAIALPQYTIAVEKARMAEVIQNMAQFFHATDIYVMENGYSSNSSSINFLEPDSPVLSIDLKAGLNCETTGTGWSYCASKNFVYNNMECTSWGCYIDVIRMSGENLAADNEYELAWYKYTDGTEEKSCFPNSDYPYSEKICASLRAQGWE